jgi:hypothetical protein
MQANISPEQKLEQFASQAVQRVTDLTGSPDNLARRFGASPAQIFGLTGLYSQPNCLQIKRYKEGGPFDGRVDFGADSQHATRVSVKVLHGGERIFAEIEAGDLDIRIVPVTESERLNTREFDGRDTLLPWEKEYEDEVEIVPSVSGNPDELILREHYIHGTAELVEKGLEEEEIRDTRYIHLGYVPAIGGGNYNARVYAIEYSSGNNVYTTTRQYPMNPARRSHFIK